MSHEVSELLGACAGVSPIRNCIPDIRSPDALRGEERWTIGVNRALGIVALRMDTVDEEVRDDVLGACGLLGKTGMAKAVLFHEGSTVTQVPSNDGSVSEGSGGISLVSDDDDRVL